MKTKDGEKIIGSDQYDVPVVNMVEVAPSSVKEDQNSAMVGGKYWYRCGECGQKCWHEVNGMTYYHKLSCSHSNGIGYGDERIEGVTERLRARK